MFWRDDIDPAHEPVKVFLKRGEFVDESRGGRVVPYKIYHPETAPVGQCPVIIWSHGFGGNRDGAGFLSRYLTAHGYVLVHITHVGTDSSLWEGKPGHPWDVLRQTKISRETTLDRFYDVPFALDMLQDWAQQNQEIGALMDFDNMGMSGHSFGAMTTQVMAGQMFPNIEGKLIRLKEDRFKAGISYSPVPISHLTEASPEEIYRSIEIPLLHMTGTEDDSPIEGFSYKERCVVFEYTGCEEKYLLVKDGGDHMVYNGTRGKLKENPLRDRHEDLIKISALAYWEAELKNDTKARDWLVSGGFQNYMGSDGTFEAGDQDNQSWIMQSR